MTMDRLEKTTLYISILRSPLLGLNDLQSGLTNLGSEKARKRIPALVMNLTES